MTKSSDYQAMGKLVRIKQKNAERKLFALRKKGEGIQRDIKEVQMMLVRLGQEAEDFDSFKNAILHKFPDQLNSKLKALQFEALRVQENISAVEQECRDNLYAKSELEKLEP